MIELGNGWMHGLKNAYHFSVARQIDGVMAEVETASQPLIAARTAVHTAFTGEDTAYKRLQKDWNVETLKAEDRKLDDYMIGIRKILDGHASMPDGEALKQPGRELLQMWKEFDFSTTDGHAAEASKVLNMWQIVADRQADAEALGVYVYFQKAATQANTVLDLVQGRTDERSQRIVGELKTARAATDAAIKQLYQVINSMQVLMPSDDITALARQLKGIEDYARQYYLSGGSSDEPEPEPSEDGEQDGGGSSDGGGGVTPVVPESGSGDE